MKINGRKIKQTRQLMHLTQKQLAAGITTQATVSQLEQHNQLPTLGILSHLLKRLELNLSEVLIGQSTELMSEHLTRSLQGQQVRIEGLRQRVQKKTI